MRTFTLLFLSCFLILACESEEIMTPEEGAKDCLRDLTPDAAITDCSTFSNPDCFLIEVGTSQLSQSSKETFADFCAEENTTITFVDAEENQLTCDVWNKNFSEQQFKITRLASPTTQCTTYCLNGEQARVSLRSDRFSLDITLHNELTGGLAVEQNLEESTGIAYNIWALYNQSTSGGNAQTIFDMSLEDFNNERVSPDTSYIRFHSSIMLNGVEYTDLYSNENRENITGYTRKEKVYFHPEDGLVGVRDSLGVLWTRME